MSTQQNGTLIRTLGTILIMLGMLAPHPAVRADATSDALNAIKDGLVGISNTASSTLSKTTSVLADTVDIQGKVDILTQAKVGFESMTGIMLEMIDNARLEAEFMLQNEFAGMQEFIGDDKTGCSATCVSFRTDLANFVGDMQEIGNILFDMDDQQVLGQVFDFTPIIDLINLMPGTTLYPLYRAFTLDGAVFDSGFLHLLEQMPGHLLDLKYALNNQCEVMLGDSDTVESVSRTIRLSSLSIMAVGTLLVAAGTTKLEPVGQIHGYVGGNIKNNPLKKIGLLLKGIGELAGSVASYGSDKLQYCLSMERQQAMLAQQQAILDRVNAILESLPSGWERRAPGK